MNVMGVFDFFEVALVCVRYGPVMNHIVCVRIISVSSIDKDETKDYQSQLYQTSLSFPFKA